MNIKNRTICNITLFGVYVHCTNFQVDILRNSEVLLFFEEKQMGPFNAFSLDSSIFQIVTLFLTWMFQKVFWCHFHVIDEKLV